MYKALGYDNNYHTGYYTRFTDADGKIRHVIVEPILKGSSLALSPQIHEIKVRTLEELARPSTKANGILLNASTD